MAHKNDYQIQKQLDKPQTWFCKYYPARIRNVGETTAKDLARHFGNLDALPITMAVQDFTFMGGSLGMAAGEAVITAANTAYERKTPLVLFIASGGARMQEGILSLMQLPRTTVAIQRLRRAGLPYIAVLTNPTTGGVTASYAMLGDVHISEPGAMIGFAGPRVIEQTIREKLPEGFQRAEFLEEHGMVDMVVPRHELRAKLVQLIGLLLHKSPSADVVTLPAPSRRRKNERFSSSSTPATAVKIWALTAVGGTWKKISHSRSPRSRSLRPVISRTAGRRLGPAKKRKP